MPTVSTTSATRSYVIDDDGDAFQVSFFVDGVQAGGAVFPFEMFGEDAALELAHYVGQGYLQGAPVL